TDAPKRFLGENISKKLGLDSNRSVILYQSEIKSKLYVQGRNRKEIAIASKSAGDNQGFSLNRALDLEINFYNNLLQWPGLSKLSFVSPVAANAFSYYRYDYAGSARVNGRVIYKIHVIPLRKYAPAFRGNIYIMKDSWRIYSV